MALLYFIFSVNFGLAESIRLTDVQTNLETITAQQSDNFRKIRLGKNFQPNPEAVLHPDRVMFSDWEIYPYVFNYDNFFYQGKNASVQASKGTVYFIYTCGGYLFGALFIPNGTDNFLIAAKTSFTNRYTKVLVIFDHDHSKEMLYRICKVDWNTKSVADPAIIKDFKTTLPEKMMVTGHWNLKQRIRYNQYLAFLFDGDMIYTPFSDGTEEYYSFPVSKSPESLGSILQKKLNDSSHFIVKEEMNNLLFCVSPLIDTKTVQKKMQAMSAHTEKMIKFLKITNYQQIQVFLFKDNTESTNLIGRTPGFALPEQNCVFISIDQSIGHEINHILSDRFFGSQRHTFLDEGFSTYYNGNDVNIHREIKPLLQSDAGLVKSLKDGSYLDTDIDYLNYSIAGSFVGYFIEKYGKEKFKTLWNSDSIQDGIQATTGRAYDKFADKWLELIKSQ